MITTVTLNASIDKAYQVKAAVRPGTVMRAAACQNTAGGKGLNVARVIKLCGEEVVASGLVGGYTGSLLEQLAQKDGLTGRFVHVNAETRCCINILDPDHKSTEFLEPGEEVSLQEIEQFFEEFETICKDSKVVTMSGSVPKGVPRDIYKELTLKMKSWGKQVILDTSGELLKAGIEAAPDMIKPNQEELGMLLDRPVETLEDAQKAAWELHRSGIRQVVVSLGKDGALMVCEDGIYHGRPPVLPVVNTVGCGDSMVAAFAVSMERGYDPEESLRYAVAVSAANALNHKTGYFEQEEFKTIYPQVVIKKI